MGQAVTCNNHINTNFIIELEGLAGSFSRKCPIPTKSVFPLLYRQRRWWDENVMESRKRERVVPGVRLPPHTRSTSTTTSLHGDIIFETYIWLKGAASHALLKKGQQQQNLKKTSLIYFTKIGKGQMWCIWYCLSSNNLAFLRNSISIIGFGQLWCTQNTLIADGYPHRMPKNQYFFLSFSFGKQFRIFKKASSYF